MKDKKKILALLALLLPLCTGIGSAWAYFTDQVVAEGGYLLEAGIPDTEIEETFESWTKHVTIVNTGEIPLYIRVRAFCGDEYSLVPAGNANWTQQGDWYYYTGNSGVLETVGENSRTPELLVEIKDRDGAPISSTPEKDKERFNVVVVWERLALQYDENGELLSSTEADWSRKMTGGDE